jgi:hypothetical protein
MAHWQRENCSDLDELVIDLPYLALLDGALALLRCGAAPDDWNDFCGGGNSVDAQTWFGN